MSSAFFSLLSEGLMAYIAKNYVPSSIGSWENLEYIGKIKRISPLEIIKSLNSLIYLGQRVKYHGWNLKVTEQSYD